MAFMRSEREYQGSFETFCQVQGNSPFERQSFALCMSRDYGAFLCDEANRSSAINVIISRSASFSSQGFGIPDPVSLLPGLGYETGLR
jgi:hypothetical protein